MSNETFKVGEVALYVRPGSPNYGRPLTITGPLQMRPIFDKGVGHRTAMTYQVESPFFGECKNPTGWLAEPQWLRKLPPPQDWVKLCQLDNIPREVTSHV